MPPKKVAQYVWRLLSSSRLSSSRRPSVLKIKRSDCFISPLFCRHTFFEREPCGREPAKGNASSFPSRVPLRLLSPLHDLMVALSAFACSFRLKSSWRVSGRRSPSRKTCQDGCGGETERIGIPPSESGARGGICRLVHETVRSSHKVYIQTTGAWLSCSQPLVSRDG